MLAGQAHLVWAPVVQVLLSVLVVQALPVPVVQVLLSVQEDQVLAFLPKWSCLRPLELSSTSPRRFGQTQPDHPPPKALTTPMVVP